MSAWIRRLITVAVISGVIAAGIWALWPQPAPVDVALIARGPLEVTVEDEGTTRVREVYTVSAPITGKMLRPPQKVGDEVVAGKTVVAVLQPTDPQFLDVRTQRVNEAAIEAAEAAVTFAEAQVTQARSQLTFMQGDLRRATELSARQAIAERTLDKAKLDVASAEAALASAIATLEVRRQELESARARMIQPGQQSTGGGTCCIQVLAPISGRVLKIVAENEQVVQAGAPLIDIGDPGALEVTVDLLSRDAVRVDAGAIARIENWGGETLNAKVRRVEPAGFTKISALGIEEQRVKVVLDFTDPPQAWQRLGHGFRIIARIVVWRGDDVLQVPLGALFRHGDAWAVFKVADGRARITPVDIAERNLRTARVTNGLSEGDTIILYPSDRIVDGIRVARRQAS
jgi:HlyD family secretion protein